MKIKNLKLKFYKHSYLLLLIPIVIITLPLLKPGSIIGDGDFPFTHNALAPDKILSTWIDFGSRNASEVLSRYPLIVIGLALQLMNVSSEVISKLMIISGFLIASFTFYYSFHLLFNNKTDTKNIKFKAAAILGSLFYAYNVWSFDRITHWYLWIGYSVLPLFFVSLICLFNKPGKKWKYVLLTVLSWSIASSTPHMLLFFGIIFIGMSSFFVIRNIYRKQDFVKSVILILSILSILVLLNSYWLYPFVLSTRSWSTDPSTLFGIVVTEETTKMFSEDSSFLNVFRLMEDLPNFFESHVGVPPNTSSLYPIWLFASFLVPILAFSALIFRTFFRYALVFSGLAIIGIILTMGTNTPFSFYSTLLFELPFSSLFRNVLRDPDKLAFLISLAYSFLLSITCFGLLRAVEKIRFNKIISSFLLFALLGVITITLSQIYKIPFEDGLMPVAVPNDFNDLNHYLNSIKTEKVLNIPYTSQLIVWNNVKDISEDFYELFSSKSSIGQTSKLPSNYYQYIINSIITNKTNNISNELVPFGTSYIIFHNDSLRSQNTNLLKRISSLAGIENIENLGIFRIFSVDKGISSINVPNQNILVSGGLDKMTSLSSLGSYNSTRSSLIYLDQNIKKESAYPIYSSVVSDLALPRKAIDLLLSLLDDKYIIAPFEATNHHDPERVWSKAGAVDLLHGEFHPYLEDLGIQNSDFDYGKGLVITKAAGAKLSIPFKVEEAGGHDIFFRYMNSQKGGQIKIDLDGKLMKEIDTFNKISNDFIWEKFGTVNLTEGKHTLTIENVAGFNAINIFAIIPPEEMEKLGQYAYSLTNNTRNIFLLEAESNFFNSKGIQQGGIVYSLINASSENHNTNVTRIKDTFKTLTNQFKVPSRSDLVTLQFLAKQKPDTLSIYKIKNLQVTPTEENQYIYRLDFEGKANQPIFNLDFEGKANQPIFNLDFEGKANQPIFNLDFEGKANQPIFNLDFEGKALEQVGFTNNNKDILSISTKTNRPISGNNSLMVDIKPANATNWNTISTDFIPANENAYYNASMDISAKDVNQLHTKLYYFDSNKKEIKSILISGGRNGTFEAPYTIIDSSPNGTKYMKLQIWVGNNVNMSSNYLVDNVKIENVPLGQVGFTNNNKDILSISTKTNRPISGNNSLMVDIKPANATNWNTISTDFIPANENAYYNASMDISAKDVNQLHTKLYYFDSNKKEIKSILISGGRNGTFEAPYTIIDSSPNGTKYMKLQIWVGNNVNMSSNYLVDNVKIENVPLGQVGFTNNNKDILSISTKTNRPISGNNSLMVDIKPANATNWNTISTDFIPANENAYYNASMDISAKDVNQLHTKLYYFDSNKKEIKSILISGGRNGTFEAPYTIIDSSPNGTKYMKLQIWVGNNVNMSSNYLVDNVKIENVPLGQVGFTNNNKDILSISTKTNRPISGNNSLMVDIKPANATNWNTISTDFIPANENAYYNASMDISAKDVNQLHTKLYYFDSNKKEIKSILISGGRNGTFEAPYTIIDSSPNGTKYMKLQIWVGNNVNMSSNYLVDNVKIENVPLGQVGFTNNNKDILSISTKTNRPISGNNSLMVDIKPANATNWNTISTDFIPANENAYYNASMDISAKDVNQLHTKLYYFDSNKKEIKSILISGGRNGTFEAPYTIIDSSPNGTKYMKLQIWVGNNLIKSSSYLIDNIMVKENSNYNVAENNLFSFENTDPADQNLTVDDKEGSLKVDLKKGNSTNYKRIETKPIPVKGNRVYNYTLTFDAENVRSLDTIVSFRNSSDVVENSTKYGANASNGNVLSLSPGSEIYTELEILKPSNYTIALRVKTCETCTFLRMNIENASDHIISSSNISLMGNSNNNSSSHLNWVYSNSTYLNQGKYEIKIYSDSQTDLDSAIIYSTNSNTRDIPDSRSSTIIDKKYNETIEDLFNANDVPPPAQVSEYKKVNPTKHLIKISNATKPYLLSFAESYDPLWKAHIENNKDNSKVTNVPLYSMINGFYINKTGDYNLTIEYHPQKWFIEGGIVSIASLIIIIGYSIVQWQNKKYSI